jgi:Uma2 family endonuclease
MATVTQPSVLQHQIMAPPVPPLEPGDHLTPEEFERRYDAMPHLKKAELIEGVVYMSSPVKHDSHGNPQFNLISWGGIFVFATPGIQGGDNGSLKLDNKNMPQPDVYLLISPNHGGQARIDEGYVVGAPDWIGEVAATTASYDLHVKLEVYRRNGVREYVIWRVLDREIDWFVLRGGKYERLALSAEGIYQSEALPGLWLDPQALIAEDLPKLQAIVQRGLATPEHQQFVERLARAATKP